MAVRIGLVSSLFFLCCLVIQPSLAYEGPGERSDRGMGRDVRTEASMQYLRARYGDRENWPCDQRIDVGVPVDQITVGQPPADTSGLKGKDRLRDKN